MLQVPSSENIKLIKQQSEIELVYPRVKTRSQQFLPKKQLKCKDTNEPSDQQSCSFDYGELQRFQSKLQQIRASGKELLEIRSNLVLLEETVCVLEENVCVIKRNQVRQLKAIQQIVRRK